MKGNFDFTLSSEDLDGIFGDDVTQEYIDQVLNLHTETILSEYQTFIDNGNDNLVKKCFVYMCERVSEKRKNLNSYIMSEVNTHYVTNNVMYICQDVVKWVVGV